MNNMNYFSNDNFMNAINIFSLIIGLKNYEENLTQNDKQEIIQHSDWKTDIALQEIQKHLKIQDKKIDKILEKLDNIKEVEKNE